MRDDELSKKITAALDAARVAGAASRAIHEHIHGAAVKDMPGVADSLGELDAIRAFAEIEGIGRGLSGSGHNSVMAGVEAGSIEGGDAFVTKAMNLARDGLLAGMRGFECPACKIERETKCSAPGGSA